MEGGRSNRPVRPVEAARPGAVQSRQQPQEEPTRPAFRPTPQRPADSKRPKRPLVIAVIAVAAALVAGWFAWGAVQNSATAIDGSRYQAVFFTDGQVYFGKLSSLNDNYMKLRDIYYLQAPASEVQETEGTNSPQRSTNSSSNNVQLIKLGEEVHGPDDEMVISRDQILFYENLKTDGKVSKSIEQHKESN